MDRGRKVMIATACAAMLCIVVVAFLPPRSEKPFADLNAADIASAQMTVIPPKKTVDIDDIPQLVGYLRELVTYRRDDSYMHYVGQSVQITLIMKNGAQKTIIPYHPFLIIDNVGYRTEYEPCEALNSYANMLVGSA